MKKLSKIGLILLLSYLSVNTLTDEDFVNLKKYFSSKSKNIFSKIAKSGFSISNLYVKMLNGPRSATRTSAWGKAEIVVGSCCNV